MDLQKQGSLLSTLAAILLFTQVALSFGIILKLNGMNQTIHNSLVEQQQGEQIPQYIENVSVDNDPMLGAEDASVTIVEFSDYECPFCAQFANNLESVLLDNSGKIKYVLRDFPLENIHPHAFKAAEAANCAGEQGKYWEMHDLLFENQEQLDTESLKEYASQLQIVDIKQFNNCLDSGKYANEIRLDIEDGNKYQVNGTPTFFVNGRRLAGPSIEQLQQAINLALEEAR